MKIEFSIQLSSHCPTFQSFVDRVNDLDRKIKKLEVHKNHLKNMMSAKAKGKRHRSQRAHLSTVISAVDERLSDLKKSASSILRVTNVNITPCSPDITPISPVEKACQQYLNDMPAETKAQLKALADEAINLPVEKLAALEAIGKEFTIEKDKELANNAYTARNALISAIDQLPDSPAKTTLFNNAVAGKYTQFLSNSLTPVNDCMKVLLTVNHAEYHALSQRVLQDEFRVTPSKNMSSELDRIFHR